MALQVGDRPRFKGNVTTLDKLPVGSGEEIERMVGYHRGRLSDGYFILLLVEAITADDFDFHGITLRSGGKTGNPGQPNRQPVQQVMTKEFAKSFQLRPDPRQAASAHIKQMKDRLVRRDVSRGPDRLAKVLPTIRHNRSIPDAVQYPPGGGALQWDLTKEAQFLVAVYVDAAGVAHTAAPDPRLRTLSINAAHGSERYEARRALRQFMEAAR